MTARRHDSLVSLTPTHGWGSIFLTSVWGGIFAYDVFRTYYLVIVAVGAVRIPKKGRWCYAPVFPALVDLLALPVHKGGTNTTKTKDGASQVVHRDAP